jgi:hypothetical protein
MPSPQKAKGSGWEREVAKFLTDMYKTQFIRAPGSGAYIGGFNTQRKTTLTENQVRSFKGDIVPGEGFENLNIECKFYSDFPTLQLLSGSCKQLDGWIGQGLDVADPDDFSILFLKFNRKGSFVLVKPDPSLSLVNYIRYNSKDYGPWLMIEMSEFFNHNEEYFKSKSSKKTEV